MVKRSRRRWATDRSGGGEGEADWSTGIAIAKSGVVISVSSLLPLNVRRLLLSDPQKRCATKHDANDDHHDNDNKLTFAFFCSL